MIGICVLPLCNNLAHAGLQNDGDDAITVTATKKTSAQNAYTTPLSVQVFDQDALTSYHFQNLTDISYAVPNVSIEDIGTFRGTANISIRGLSINSSIPSIDPAVGIFVDGVYLGLSGGALQDTYDVDRVEILRGPQGVLFGRNVTGGAVVVRSAKPDSAFAAQTTLATQTGLRGTGGTYLGTISLTGALSENVSGRVALYAKDDQGWFKNAFDGSNVGATRTLSMRPSLRYHPTKDWDITLKFEYSEITGDGAVTQNRALFDHGFNVNIDTPGKYDASTHTLSLSIDKQTSIGNGKITAISGWRDFTQATLNDIDSSPDFIFTSPTRIEQSQFSQELRYAGRFADRVDVTSGLYIFTQTLAYDEARLGPIFVPSGSRYGGGEQDHTTYGVFANMDLQATPNWNVTMGGRYTFEKKDVAITTLADMTPCAMTSTPCPRDMTNKDTWANFSPRLGVHYTGLPQTLVYANYAQSFRSGGYNLRNTVAHFDVQAFDPEDVRTIEAGVKITPASGVFLDAGLFHTRIEDIQRDVNFPDPNIEGNLIQLVTNAGDAEINGIELTGEARLGGHVRLTGGVGLLNGGYTAMRFDMDRDGLITQADKDLKIPRLANLTYQVGLHHRHDLRMGGRVKSQLRFAHRDDVFFTDNNAGRLQGADMLDASITLMLPDNGPTIALYGKNLLDAVTQGGDTPLGSLGSFTVLNKGSVFGITMSKDF